MTDAVPFELTILGLAALLSALQLIALSACAGAFLVARGGYVLLFALGIPYLRSLVWMGGFIASILMLLAALL